MIEDIFGLKILLLVKSITRRHPNYYRLWGGFVFQKYVLIGKLLSWRDTFLTAQPFDIDVSK